MQPAFGRGALQGAAVVRLGAVEAFRRDAFAEQLKARP